MGKGATVNAEVELLTVRDAATELGVTPMTVYRWARSGRMTAYQLGAHATVVSRADVERLRAERPEAE